MRDGVDAGALARGAADRARARRARGAGSPGRDDLLRRRHAVADGARNGRRLIARTRQLWDTAPDVEITLEANPTSVEQTRFAALRDAGVNRVSLGVQALDRRRSSFLGREHSADEAMAAIETARRHFARYSFDLIYARPGQTPDAWPAELDGALALAGEHLSLYQLTIERGTRFFAEHARGGFVAARRGGSRARCSSARRRGSKPPGCPPTRFPIMHGRARHAAII